MDPSTFSASNVFHAPYEIERTQQRALLPEAVFDALAVAVDRPGRRIQAFGAAFPVDQGRGW